MEKEKIQELIEYAETLYNSNISIDEIKKAMIRQGADEELAIKIIQIVDKSLCCVFYIDQRQNKK
jgi:hypothetical protein